MQWIITKDHISKPHEKSAVNRMRCPHDLADRVRLSTPEEKARLHAEFLATMTDEFRLFDDDGTLYYEGLCKGLDNQDGDSAFEPLDWAAANAGCARMDTRKVGAKDWAVL